MQRERAERGDEARARLQFRLLTTDHLSDFMAGLAAVRSMPGADPTRVAVAGVSFGGQLAVLAAERDSTLKAALSFAGAANSWNESIELQQRLLGAVERSVVPTFIAHAANDLSIEPGKALAAVMERQGRAHRLIIYPPFGTTPAQGHAFMYLAPDQWEPDVFQFLAEYVRD
jgi:dienelactone hydrolase